MDNIQFSFTPLLLIHSPNYDSITPFNFISLDLIMSSHKIRVLSSLPFASLRSAEKEEIKDTLHIRFVYPKDGLVYLKNYSFDVIRPILVWTNLPYEAEANLIDILISKPSLGLLVISSNKDICEHYTMKYKEEKLYSFLYIKDGYKINDEPQIIWSAFTELLLNLGNKVDIEKVTFRIAPNFWLVQNFKSIYLSSLQNSFSEGSLNFSAVDVYDDFITYPNSIMLNHIQGKMPNWIPGALPPEIGYPKMIQESRKIFELKFLEMLLKKVFIVSEQDNDRSRQQLLPYIYKLPEEFVKKVLQLFSPEISALGKGKLIEDIYSNYPADIIRTLLPARYIVVSQSFPIDFELSLNYLARSGAISQAQCQYMIDDKDYAKSLYSTFTEGGRMFKFIKPESEQRKLLLEGLYKYIIKENDYISTIALYYAMKMYCPVFKTDRVGYPIFEEFNKIDELFNDAPEATPSDVLFNSSKEHLLFINQLETHFENISSGTSSILRKDMLNEFFADWPDPLLHFFSDIPMEFIKTSDDYLGYKAQISRSPTTLGSWLFDTLSNIDLISSLDNKSTQIVILTPFASNTNERQKMNDVIKTIEHIPNVTTKIVESKQDIINYFINNTQIKCLIYFGHGGIDRKTGKSWIQLSDGVFYNQDVYQIKNVPPVVVLIGCHTASGGTTLYGMDIPFLSKGALVIATTFAIPMIIGLSFLGMFLSNFISSGVNYENFSYRYRDLSEILSVVKRRIRHTSIYYSLLEKGKIKYGEFEKILSEHVEKFAALPKDETANDFNHMKILKDILLAHGIIDNINLPLYEIEKIPYTLFFTCLGFPWQKLNSHYV